MDLCDRYKEYEREEIKNKILSISLNNDFWKNLISSRFPNLKHENSISVNAKKIYLRTRKAVLQKQGQFEQIVRNVQNTIDSDADILTAQRDSDNDSRLVEVIASPQSGGCENAASVSFENMQILTADSSTNDQDVENIESQNTDNYSIIEGTHEIPLSSDMSHKISAIGNSENIESTVFDVSRDNSHFFARGNLVWASCGGWFPGN